MAAPRRADQADLQVWSKSHCVHCIYDSVYAFFLCERGSASRRMALDAGLVGFLGTRATSPPRVVLRARTPEVRPPSRGRTPAGKRKSLRFINDNLIPARSIWGRDGVTEDAIAERLEHMYIKLDHHSVFETLLTDDAHRDLLVAFRRGEQLSVPRAAPPAPRRAPRATEVLSHLFGRVDRRTRALLLRHVRIEGGGGAAFVASCELLLQALMDGGPAAGLAEFAAAAEHVFLRAPAWEEAPLGVTLALADGYHRVLVAGLAQFYGLRSVQWEEEEEAGDGAGGSARCVRVTLPPEPESDACAPRDEAEGRYGAAAVAAVRRALGTAVDAQQAPAGAGTPSDVAAVPPPPDAEGAAEPEDVARRLAAEVAGTRPPPLVPLFVVYARSIDRHGPVRLAAPAGRRRE